MPTIKKDEKIVESGLATLQAQVNEIAATLRRLIKRAEQHWGTDVDGDGKVGSVRVAMLIVVLFAAIAFGANQLVWKIGDSAYVDEEGDAVFNTVTADITGDVTASTVSGSAATDEVLSMGYATINTDSTVTSAGSYFVDSSGAEVTLTLPDAADHLGKTIRVVLETAGNNLNVNLNTNNVYVAGDGGAADNKAVFDAALDAFWIQAISTSEWGVLSQTSVSSYTTQ